MSEAAASSTREKLLDEFNSVVSETEKLLRAVASGREQVTGDFRARMEKNLHDAKVRLQDLEETMVEKGKVAARATDEFVHDHPWQAIGVAAGVGFLIGWLLSRR
jgi:ElaB/YqjD/DUF883 family membrane-anchored ribosome-binding protein